MCSECSVYTLPIQKRCVKRRFWDFTKMAQRGYTENVEHNVGKRRTDRRTGRDDGGTFVVHVTVNVTLYGICVYTVDGEEVCFCREYT